MKKYFYTLMAVAVMCFVGCSEKNSPNDEGNSSASANMADYVGTWNVATEDTEEDGKLLCVQLKSDKTCIFILELSDQDAAEYNVQKGTKVAYYVDEWWVKKDTYGGKENVSFGFSGKHEGYFTAFYGYTYTVNKVEKNKLTLSWYEGGVGDIMTYFTRTSDETMKQHLKECFDNNEGIEEDKTPSMNMADYVGTWKYDGYAINSDIIDYIQLKANGTAIIHNTGNINGDFWHGKWEIQEVTWAEKSTIGLYVEMYYNKWLGADLIGVDGIAISGAQEILEMGENKIKASDYGFDNIFYLVKVSDSTMDNLLNNWEYKDEWLLFGE